MVGSPGTILDVQQRYGLPSRLVEIDLLFQSFVVALVCIQLFLHRLLILEQMCSLNQIVSIRRAGGAGKRGVSFDLIQGLTVSKEGGGNILGVDQRGERCHTETKTGISHGKIRVFCGLQQLSSLGAAEYSLDQFIRNGFGVIAETPPLEG